MKNKRLLIILATAAVLLLIPFIAMQFTNEVNWSIFDFAIMGGMLTGTGLLIELTLRIVKSWQNRLIICGVVFVLFLLVWAEIAVGIFGSPFAGS
jgi:hypothetical protein